MVPWTAVHAQNVGRRTWYRSVCVCDERSYLSDERVNEVWALILSFLSRELISMWCVEVVEVKADARDGVSSTTVCVCGV